MDFLKNALKDHSSDSNSSHSGSQPPKPASTHEQLLGTLAGALGGGSNHSSSPPPQSQSHGASGLLGSLGSVLGHGKPQEPPKPQSLGDKINSAFGGGSAGEKKEDKLDKAIDLFQEHILKEGPQNNESALEQAKDKIIADTIRDNYKKITGHNFPGGQK
ncbi:hypothetical protein AX16_004151 [Volvariella volvacea WC 439]|nr:hypothetical protein AX16_004151 [Volvariella volvacea WC 439]